MLERASLIFTEYQFNINILIELMDQYNVPIQLYNYYFTHISHLDDVSCVSLGWLLVLWLNNKWLFVFSFVSSYCMLCSKLLNCN